MRRRAAAACIVILPDELGFLQYTVLQIAIVSEYFSKNVFVRAPDRFTINCSLCSLCIVKSFVESVSSENNRRSYIL